MRQKIVESCRHSRQSTVPLLFALLLASAFQARLQSGQPSDKNAVSAINKLGGSIRPFIKNKPGVEVDFHLRGRKLTDKGLAHVAGLKNVMLLDLRDTQITSAGLVHLKGLKQLRWLHLERTKTGDEGIKYLANLVNLEYLNLYGTKITDKALIHLTQLKKLKRLYVWQTKVTDNGAARLQKALPKLRIIRGDNLKVAALPKPPKAKDLKWIPADKLNSPKSLSGPNTEIVFENKSGRHIKIYWIKYGGGLKLYGELKPGGTRRQNTYARNTWLITDEKEKPLGYFIAIAAPACRAVIPGLK